MWRLSWARCVCFCVAIMTLSRRLDLCLLSRAGYSHRHCGNSNCCSKWRCSYRAAVPSYFIGCRKHRVKTPISHSPCSFDRFSCVSPSSPFPFPLLYPPLSIVTCGAISHPYTSCAKKSHAYPRPESKKTQQHLPGIYFICTTHQHRVSGRRGDGIRQNERQTTTNNTNRQLVGKH
jgi:hypothetical protein